MLQFTISQDLAIYSRRLIQRKRLSIIPKWNIETGNNYQVIYGGKNIHIRFIYIYL